MCTTGDSGEIIILSDDDDNDNNVSRTEASVLIVEVEDVKENDVALPQSLLDEDLVVTFSRRAEVLPHARYDCATHAFTATDCETGAPVDSNQAFCDNCFCYICDKLASLCTMWCHSGTCHCNSHKRSDFWNNLRNDGLLGGLKKFNLSLSEVDLHLRQAETMLQSFRQELAVLFSAFVKGKTLEEYGLSLQNQQGIIHDYRPVYEFVSSFLSEANRHDTRAAAIMQLGATEEFIRHFHVTGSYPLQCSMSNAAEAKILLLQRVISSVQKQIVMGDFTPSFSCKVQDFYKQLCLPTDLRSMRNSLCIRPWDDVLLMSVMKGQNVLGVRKDKGKKDVLVEQSSVVLLRTELLQEQCRYKELYRYLRVVQADDPTLLQQLQDLIPFFKCMAGDLKSAVDSMFPSVKAPVTRLTPPLFTVYLCIFETATAPKLVVSHLSQLCRSDATWQPIKDAVPLKRAELVKFALRSQKLCSAVFADSQCWAHLLSIANTRTALPEPSKRLLNEATLAVNTALQNPDGSNLQILQIPHFIQEVEPDQSLLLLATGALCLRLYSGALNPVVPVLNTFKDNMWALRWLWSCLGLRLKSFFQEIREEVKNTTVAAELFSPVKALFKNFPWLKDAVERTDDC
ncbi:uncharacterized protein zgc:112980 isoform X2 [Betta splendens]|uniref:Uncharacterized protein zgc:112980 isoform X2 n=1 Tax=Betta splendens TaxID=158456 RepID=A0A6P7M9J0_BETSP|nr:uncharacterized protein zgc:112980 isoform X2 [Betta splendens]